MLLKCSLHLSQHQKIQGKKYEVQLDISQHLNFHVKSTGSRHHFPEISQKSQQIHLVSLPSINFPFVLPMKIPRNHRRVAEVDCSWSVDCPLDQPAICAAKHGFWMFLECFGYNFEKTSFGYRIFLDLLISGCPTTSLWLLCFMPIFGKSTGRSPALADQGRCRHPQRSPPCRCDTDLQDPQNQVHQVQPMDVNQLQTSLLYQTLTRKPQ